MTKSKSPTDIYWMRYMEGSQTVGEILARKIRPSGKTFKNKETGSGHLITFT